MNDIAETHRDRIGIIAVFVLIFVVGLLVFDDYGTPFDDPIERTTTLVNLKYILSTVAPNYRLPPVLAAQPDLPVWVDRYYGVAAQLPTAVFEWLFNFRFGSSAVYQIRHLWTFLQFFIGLIFFFRLLKLRFRSDRAALAGVLLLWLSPRIFANSFYNIKDLPFLSWVIVSVYFLFRRIESGSRRDLVLFGLTAAIVTNIRVIGGLLVIIWLGNFFYRTVTKADPIRRTISDFVLLSAVYGLGWVMVTPFAWRDPVNVMIDTIRQFSNYRHVSSELYFGIVTLNSELPWHYLPVWIGVTSPVLVIFGFLIGVFLSVRNHSDFSGLFDRQRDLSVLTLALVPIGLAIGLGSPVYNGWRHFYFVYPWMVYFAVLFLERMFDSDRQTVRFAAWSALAVSLIVSAAWLTRFHPYQMVYFNALLPKSERIKFEKDYWCVSCRDAIQPVMDADSNLRIVFSTDGTNLAITMAAVPAADRNRIYLADWSDDYSEKDYLFIGFSGMPTDSFDFPAFEEVNRLSVDGLALEGIYRRVTKRLVPGESVSVHARTVSGESPIPELSDWDRATEWAYDEMGQGEQAALQIELAEPRQVDGITLRTVIQRNGLPDEVLISVSADGESYRPVKLTDSSYSEFFFEPAEARYLRIEGAAFGTAWNLCEAQVWEAGIQEPQ